MFLLTTAVRLSFYAMNMCTPSFSRHSSSPTLRQIIESARNLMSGEVRLFIFFSVWHFAGL